MRLSFPFLFQICNVILLGSQEEFTGRCSSDLLMLLGVGKEQNSDQVTQEEAGVGGGWGSRGCEWELGGDRRLKN